MKLTTDSKIVQQARLIVEAAEKGLEIQEFEDPCYNWQEGDGTFRLGYPDVSYRIKPEPKMVWVNEYGNDDFFAYARKEDALAVISCASRKAVPYREVTE